MKVNNIQKIFNKFSWPVWQNSAKIKFSSLNRFRGFIMNFYKFLGPIISYKDNGVLRIQPQMSIAASHM